MNSMTTSISSAKCFLIHFLWKLGSKKLMLFYFSSSSSSSFNIFIFIISYSFRGLDAGCDLCLESVTAGETSWWQKGIKKVRKMPSKNKLFVKHFSSFVVVNLDSFSTITMIRAKKKVPSFINRSQTFACRTRYSFINIRLT